MKPVKEIALILDVSQVTVYNHINKIKDDIKSHIFNVKGATYLDKEGIRQLKISMGLLQVPEIRENISMSNIIDEISDIVSKQISIEIKKHHEYTQLQIRNDNIELKDNIKKDNDLLLDKIEKDNADMKIQVEELKKQNETLIGLISNKSNKTFFQKIKDLF